MTRSPELQAQRDRSDLWAGIIVCAVVTVVIVNQAVTAITDLFSVPGAVTTTVPIGSDAVPLPADAGFDGTVISAQVSEAGVSPVATACFVIGIVLAALGLIAATALGCLFCVRMLRGNVFSPSNTRVLFAISMLLLLAPVAGSFFRNMGLNGLFAAAGSEYDGQWSATVALLPAFVAAMAVGVMVIAFRRGERLQRDTEGLV